MVSQADLIGRASAPALAFDDEKVARENLSLLKGRPRIAAAAIYNAKGKLFASYVRQGEGGSGAEAQLPQVPATEGYTITGNQIQLFKRIEANNREQLGTIYMLSSYDVMERLQSYLAILGVVMVVSLLAALLMASWLQASVTQPILAVTDVARQVVTQRDFSLRVRKTTDDEVGYLVDAFNAMLAEIGRQTRALEGANSSLHLEMGERRAAEKALLAADRQKDEFLATLAHELRNPLAPLLNAVDILRMAGDDARATQSAREMMARQLNQMVQLVNDLLDVSRITTGKMVLKMERTALAGIVQTALEAARPLIDGRGHTLVVTLPAQPVWLMADATRLAQVVVNLLNNAAKFTDTGGTIYCQAEQAGNELVLKVSDTGLGIAAQMLPLIFDMFAQADRSLERAHAGLGVGLSLARYLVEAHGGSISAASAGAGQGSEFTVRLPTMPAEAAPVAVAHEPAQAAGNPAHYRILLADDNVDFAASLAMLLEAMGHEVLVANDGQRALEIAPGFRPDFCFLDIGLPKVHGYDLARGLRKNPVTSGAVLVAVSGWGQENDKRRSREAGFDHHLVKPVNFEQIEAVLASFAARVGRP
jgi:signal transduction histidine kinase/ActR/RegA family two-component response regulator